MNEKWVNVPQQAHSQGHPRHLIEDAAARRAQWPIGPEEFIPPEGAHPDSPGMQEEFVPDECLVCGAVYGHDPDCADMARNILARMLALAADAQIKGGNLQTIPELRLVGNAYCGMSERMFKVLDGISRRRWRG